MPPEPADASYLQGLLVGIQNNQTEIKDWQRDFSEKHSEDMERIAARMTSLEVTVTHDRATRAAWNQILAGIGAIALAATTFFSGAFNHFFK